MTAQSIIDIYGLTTADIAPDNHKEGLKDALMKYGNSRFAAGILMCAVVLLQDEENTESVGNLLAAISETASIKKSFLMETFETIVQDEQFSHVKEVIEKYNVVNYEVVKKLKGQYQSGKEYLYNRLWLIIVLHWWLEENNKPSLTVPV